jgi:hypothetical protein
MDKKYTTITITKEISKRLRLMALRNDMKTQDFLCFMLDTIENQADKVLFNEVDEDLKEINKKKK